MTGDLTPIFEIAGIAVATLFVEKVMENFGHGDKVVFVRIVGYSAAALHGFRTWFRYMHAIASMFGVYV